MNSDTAGPFKSDGSHTSIFNHYGTPPADSQGLRAATGLPATSSSQRGRAGQLNSATAASHVPVKSAWSEPCRGPNCRIAWLRQRLSSMPTSSSDLLARHWQGLKLADSETGARRRTDVEPLSRQSAGGSNAGASGQPASRTPARPAWERR